MTVSDDLLPRLEAIAAELIELFGFVTPPVPIEDMLQHPINGMWDEVDIAQLSSGFLSLEDRYTPRMALARLLVRQVAHSAWGQERDVLSLLKQDENVHAFARMLVMPAVMVRALSEDARNPATMRLHFEVPESDVRSRLEDLATLL